MKLETLGIYIYIYMRRHEQVWGALAQDEDSVCKARVRILLYERFPRFRPRSRPRARRAPRVARGLVGSWVFVGLRASPIVLRPEISHLLVIRRDARTRLRLFHVNYVKFARVNVHVVRQCGLNAAK